MRTHPGGAGDPAEAAEAIERPSGSQRVLATTGVMMTIFLGAVGQTSLVTAMPAIIADIGGFDRYAWAHAAYLIASTVATLVAGRLSDIYGRRTLLLVGLAILAAASVPVVLVGNMTQLALLRGIQGLGGGAVMACSTIAVADLYAPRERGRIQGLVGAVVFLSIVIGPLLAGLLADTASWRWILLINVPAGLLVAAVIARTFPRMSAAAGTAGGTGNAETAGTAGTTGSTGTVGAAASVMPLSLYRNRTLTAGAALMILTSFGLYGNILFVPLFFQAVQGFSATGGGGILAPLGLGVVLGGVVSGQLISRTGGHYRLHAIVGTVFMAAGTFLLAGMGPETELGLAAVYLVTVGWGAGAMGTTVTVAVQNSTPFAMVGAATATLHFWRLVSGAAGLAALGAVLAARFASRLEASLSVAVRSVLPPGQLDALKSDPQVLGDPAAADALRAALAEAGPAAAGAANELLAALREAVDGAVGDAMAMCAAAMTLAIVASLFLEPRETPAGEGLGDDDDPATAVA